MEKERYSKLFTEERDAVLITSVDNIQYTVGFRTAARRPAQIGQTAVLLYPDKAIMFCPQNWRDIAAASVSKNTEVVAYAGGISNLALCIQNHIDGKATCIGFEEENIDLRLFRELNINDRIKWLESSEVFRRCRAVKDSDEIEHLKRSAVLVSKAMDKAAQIILPGKTEWQVMSELEFFMRENGSSGTPFTIKVLSGANALKTINLPGQNEIKQGDIVLLDMGATVEGYASDMSRSFVLGKASRDQMDLYNLVLNIEKECITKIKSGTTYSELMQTAFDILHGHRYEKYFNPFLGHNIGICSQELPNIIPNSGDVFETGAVVTIEPGIYVPGVGGIRIEDEVLVGDDGPTVLTGLTNEIFELSC